MRVVSGRMAVTCILSLFYFGSAFGHGLVQDPPSRNWFCGFETKPDQVLYGVPINPVCGDAFQTPEFFNGGYSFMSVLTHDLGRKSVEPLPENVCGFDAETFNFGPTPWDEPIDWPTTPMSAGTQKFTWNISWGSHFSDTEDFRYYITKPGFDFEVGTRLNWDDFEETAFCELYYDDANPNDNPAVVALKGTAQFDTFCEVPARSGRHVIYAEWGRNQFTLERFHGCIDVVFDGTVTPEVPDTVESVFSSPFADNEFSGAGAVLLDGTRSTGGDLSYSWTINAPDSSLYSLDSAESGITSLNLTNPLADQTVMITLRVTDSDGETDSETVTFQHSPDVEVAPIVSLGPLTETPQSYAAGDMIRLRLVTSDGQDVFYPEEAVVLTEDNASADQWTAALATAVNAEDTFVKIGVLDEGQQRIETFACATCNNVYIVDGPEFSGAFVERMTETPIPEPVPYVFSRTDKNEFRYIAVNQNGEVGNVWISEACAASLGGAIISGDWNDLLEAAPAKDTIPNPCTGVLPPTNTSVVFSRTDKVEFRYITQDSTGQNGSIWISEACAASLGGATVSGDWFELLDLAPGFDTVANPCIDIPRPFSEGAVTVGSTSNR